MSDLSISLCTLFAFMLIGFVYLINLKQKKNSSSLWKTVISETYFNKEPGKENQKCIFELQVHQQTFEIRLIENGDYTDYDLADIMNEKRHEIELKNIEKKYDRWRTMLTQ